MSPDGDGNVSAHPCRHVSTSSRRKLLRTGALGALFAIGGCLGLSGGSDGTDGTSNATDAAGQDGSMAGEDAPWEQSIPVAPRSLVAAPKGHLVYAGRYDRPIGAVDVRGVPAWRRSQGGSLVGVNGVAVLARRSGTADLTAVNPVDGTVAWEISLPGPYEWPTAVAASGGQTVLLSQQDGGAEGNPPSRYTHLIALDSGTGDVRWHRELPQLRRWRWRLDATQTRILGLVEDGWIHAYGREGALEWRRSMGVEVETPPQIVEDPAFEFSRAVETDGTVYVGAYRLYGEPPRRILALNRADGSVRWRRAGFDLVLGADDRRLYVGNSGRSSGAAYEEHLDLEGWEGERAQPPGDRPTIAAVDLGTGALDWTTTVGSLVGYAAAITDTAAYLTVEGDGFEIYAVDLATGDAVAVDSLPGNRATPPVAIGDAVFVGGGTYRQTGGGEESSGGTVHAFPADGSR